MQTKYDQDKFEIKLYNSLTNSIETFKPINEGKVSMYVCGPTVYNHAHIGNARPIVFFDAVKRFFKYIGYEVTFASNFTDIDDRIIKKAKEENKTEVEIATEYINAYLDLSSKLGCEMDVIRPKVTENIDGILSYINELVDKGFAYQCGDDVYFRVNSDPTYGVLSNQKLDELDSGARIEVNEGKEDPRDFTLWKKTNDDGIKWNSSFGAGRPGWHTECLVMIDKIFKGVIDIHGGGIDLRFPHHENEIAQNYCLHHNYLSNYWLHNARVDLKGEKMSKSLGNIIWAKDIIEKYNPNAFRLLMLSNHYRQTINYMDDMMEQMEKEWIKIENTYISLYRKVELFGDLSKGKTLPIINDFIKEMAYDINTSNALTIIYQLLKDINKALRDKTTDINFYQDLLKTLSDMLYVFGLKPSINALTDEEKDLVISWYKARENKDFEKADIARSKINELGIRL